MWGTSKILIFLLLLMVVGCADQKSFFDANRNNINKVPVQIETPDAPLPDSFDQPNENTSTTTSAPDTTVVTAASSQTTSVSSTTAAAAEAELKPGQFIKIAHWVVLKEARQLGTPCNIYLRRVLELAGFANDSFLANDFDDYARKNFSVVKTQTFNRSQDRARLKHHLFNYAPRTPFIMQWPRPGKTGHVAIVERIGTQLIIYQANLGRHVARREQTTIESLLDANGRSRLVVYSEFKR